MFRISDFGFRVLDFMVEGLETLYLKIGLG